MGGGRATLLSFPNSPIIAVPMLKFNKFWRGLLNSSLNLSSAGPKPIHMYSCLVFTHFEVGKVNFTTVIFWSMAHFFLKPRRQCFFHRGDAVSTSCRPRLLCNTMAAFQSMLIGPISSKSVQLWVAKELVFTAKTTLQDNQSRSFSQYLNAVQWRVP